MARKPISDELWLTLEPLLPAFIPSPKGGRRRSVDDRAALDGILTPPAPRYDRLLLEELTKVELDVPESILV